MLCIPRATTSIPTRRHRRIKPRSPVPCLPKSGVSLLGCIFRALRSSFQKNLVGCVDSHACDAQFPFGISAKISVTWLWWSVKESMMATPTRSPNRSSLLPSPELPSHRIARLLFPASRDCCCSPRCSRSREPMLSFFCIFPLQRCCPPALSGLHRTPRPCPASRSMMFFPSSLRF